MYCLLLRYYIGAILEVWCVRVAGKVIGVSNLKARCDSGTDWVVSMTMIQGISVSHLSLFNICLYGLVAYSERISFATCLLQEELR